MELDQLTAPAIIVSASGMATGGRVLHHLRRLPARPPGVGGARRVPGRADAGPAAGRRRPPDQAARPLPDGAGRGRRPAGLLRARRRPEVVDWLSSAGEPRAVFVVHGEPSSAEALAEIVGAASAGRPSWHATATRSASTERRRPFSWPAPTASEASVPAGLGWAGASGSTTRTGQLDCRNTARATGPRWELERDRRVSPADDEAAASAPTPRPAGRRVAGAARPARWRRRSPETGDSRLARICFWMRLVHSRTLALVNTASS